MPNRSSIAKPTKAELIAARIHNMKVSKEQRDNKCPCGQGFFLMGGDYKNYWLIAPGNHNWATASRKNDDIIAGSICGVIPFDNLDGDDGLLIHTDGSVERVELKLAMKTIGRYEIGPGGGIRAKLRQGLKSTKAPNAKGDTKANYEIVNNLAKKNVLTFLTIVDVDTWEVIEIVALKGADVLQHLKYNQATGELKTGKKRSIPLTYFLEKGELLEVPGLEKVGLEAWEARIYDRDGRDPKQTIRHWNTERKGRLTILWNTGVKLDVIQKEFPEVSKKSIQAQAKYLGLKRPRNQQLTVASYPYK